MIKSTCYLLLVNMRYYYYVPQFQHQYDAFYTFTEIVNCVSWYPYFYF